ncbi:MAG: DUF3299 domain-containing protein [Thiothrix sp.]|nr:DUF3299 domain-containing protein [Thiothrix sp.]HPQ97116.1 DUF3299 domain-containing protein [Thiolinea sp.]
MKTDHAAGLLVLLLVAGLGLSACGGTEKTAQKTSEPDTERPASAGVDLMPPRQQGTTAAAAVKLPDNAPAIGTDIKTLVKPQTPPDQNTRRQLMWDDLIPATHDPEKIMLKYQQQIDATPEGSPEERMLLDTIMEEFNNAPANDQLNGLKVRIPGFVSPLDERDGQVGEFLLVPYFGSCIHSPPPPVNQTVLVRPQTGKSIPMEQIGEAVWVTGDMKVTLTDTELAPAGYLIENAALEIYTEANALPD